MFYSVRESYLNTVDSSLAFRTEAAELEVKGLLACWQRLTISHCQATFYVQKLTVLTCAQHIPTTQRRHKYMKDTGLPRQILKTFFE